MPPVSSAVRVAAASSMSAATTRAPSAARARAIAPPRPPPAPPTKARLAFDAEVQLSPPQVHDPTRQRCAALPQQADDREGGDPAGARVLRGNVLDRHRQVGDVDRARSCACSGSPSGRPRSRPRVRSGPIPASASATATLRFAGKPRAASRALPEKTRSGSVRLVERDAAPLDEARRRAPPAACGVVSRTERSRPRPRRRPRRGRARAPVGTVIRPPRSRASSTSSGWSSSAPALRTITSLPAPATASAIAGSSAAGAHSTTRSAEPLELVDRHDGHVDAEVARAPRRPSRGRARRPRRGARRGRRRVAGARARARSRRSRRARSRLRASVHSAVLRRRGLDRGVVLGDLARGREPDPSGRPATCSRARRKLPQAERLPDDERVHGDPADERLLLGLLQHLVDGRRRSAGRSASAGTWWSTIVGTSFTSCGYGTLSSGPPRVCIQTGWSSIGQSSV